MTWLLPIPFPGFSNYSVPEARGWTRQTLYMCSWLGLSVPLLSLCSLVSHDGYHWQGEFPFICPVAWALRAVSMRIPQERIPWKNGALGAKMLGCSSAQLCSRTDTLGPGRSQFGTGSGS